MDGVEVEKAKTQLSYLFRGKVAAGRKGETNSARENKEKGLSHWERS